jgi:Tfp pilus assembly protein PilF
MIVRHEAGLARLLDRLRPRERDDGVGSNGSSPHADPKEKLREGRAHLRGGAYDRAVASFTEVIRHSGTCLEAHVLRAEAYRHQREYDRALSALHEAHRLAPTNAAVLFDRGVVRGGRRS